MSRIATIDGARVLASVALIALILLQGPKGEGIASALSESQLGEKEMQNSHFSKPSDIKKSVLCATFMCCRQLWQHKERGWHDYMGSACSLSVFERAASCVNCISAVLRRRMTPANGTL